MTTLLPRPLENKEAEELIELIKRNQGDDLRFEYPPRLDGKILVFTGLNAYDINNPNDPTRKAINSLLDTLILGGYFIEKSRIYIDEKNYYVLLIYGSIDNQGLWRPCTKVLAVKSNNETLEKLVRLIDDYKDKSLVFKYDPYNSAKYDIDLYVEKNPRHISLEDISKFLNNKGYETSVYADHIRIHGNLDKCKIWYPRKYTGKNQSYFFY